MEWAATDLTCRRGGRAVLRGVTLRGRPGGALVLRGPNGAGKTTLLRTLAGLAPPGGGRIDAPPGGFAYAGHADGMKAQLTVAENLAFWSRAFGAAPDAAARAAGAFDLAAILGRRASDLSAGQRRRAGLARLALTGRPVWLMDEPTASLDAAQAARVEAVVAAHLAAGGGAVIAAHGPLALAAACDVDVAAFAAAPGAAPEDDPFAAAVE